MRLSPRRGYLFTGDDPADVARALPRGGRRSPTTRPARSPGIAIEGEQLMRRLTDLDLERCPAAGPFAARDGHRLRDEGERFRVYVPQELGHYVAVAVAATRIEGLTARDSENIFQVAHVAAAR